MRVISVAKPPLPWWAAGLLLGLVQILAMALAEPLGVSTQFVIADAKVMKHLAPDYVQDHPLIGKEKYQSFGYGWWFDVGLVIGAFGAAVILGRWKLRTTTVWWRRNHGRSVAARLLTGFCGGFFILLGARFAHGCTSGQFASGWAQLSLSAVPFTVTMFAFGILAAHLLYPKIPEIEE